MSKIPMSEDQYEELARTPYVVVDDPANPPWPSDRVCPECGEKDLPLIPSVPPMLHYIKHCGKSWVRGPLSFASHKQKPAESAKPPRVWTATQLGQLLLRSPDVPVYVENSTGLEPLTRIELDSLHDNEGRVIVLGFKMEEPNAVLTQDQDSPAPQRDTAGE